MHDHRTLDICTKCLANIHVKNIYISSVHLPSANALGLSCSLLEYRIYYVWRNWRIFCSLFYWTLCTV